ncbi:MAG: hypothetical protein V1769_02980 [Thermoplasmatota archaeon]
MPHVVLNGKVNIDEIFNKFKVFLIRNDTSIIKTENFYISRDNKSMIIESLVIENGVKTFFFVMIGHRDDGIVVRIYPRIEVEKTIGVKMILSEIAKQIISIFPDLQIGETNLLDYLKTSSKP